MKRILNWIRSHLGRKPKVIIITDYEEWLRFVSF